jgi:RNA polymerase sigma-70 factor (ECF subfamily)
MIGTPVTQSVAPPQHNVVTQDHPPSTPAEITRLLRDWQGGNREALDRLVPLVYDELHVIAARYMAGERRVESLQTTALVNEAFLKLVDQRHVDWQNRAHFFAIAARLMRRILIDDARRRLREKHGGGVVLVDVDDVPVAAPAAPVDVIDLLELDRALQELERLDPDQARIVELRFFGGLTVEETAAVVGSSPATVKREWAVARGWLHRALTRSGEPPSGA